MLKTSNVYTVLSPAIHNPYAQNSCYLLGGNWNWHKHGRWLRVKIFMYISRLSRARCSSGKWNDGTLCYGITWWNGSFQTQTAIPGYHNYKDSWIPTTGIELVCCQERANKDRKAPCSSVWRWQQSTNLGNVYGKFVHCHFLEHHAVQCDQ